jgi:sugar-specific transcriptional regulator TrmB
MRVAINQSVQIETEVTVTVDDITSAMQELIDEAERRKEEHKAGAMNDRQVSFGVSQVAAAARQCLRAITDDMIYLFPVETRLSMARSLQEQADRWKRR